LTHLPQVNIRWVACLEEEFFNQGDREKAAGIPVSPLMDRDKPGVSKSQPGFYDFVSGIAQRSIPSRMWDYIQPCF
jgi:hypothetical protein